MGASYIVSAFGMFDLAQPDPYRLEGEQAMWMMTAKELPSGAVFDLGMPKPTAEVMIAGHAAALGGEPVQRIGLAWAIGNLQKQLLVTGDRVWRMAGATAVPTEPQSFLQMPLVPQRCFGGEGHGSNPAGIGFRAQERLMARETVALPNIETPEVAIRSIGDTPPPPRFGPMAVDAKERLQYSGTYDDHWIKNLAPALAEDADPRLFLFAPPDQRLPQHLEGNEGYGLRNFAADAPEIQQHLPGFRVRCFIGWTDPQKPIVELPMRIDTLWFFAGARRGVMVYRGATPVEDIEAADIADVMLAYERMGEEPRPLSHYLQVRALRTNPETAFKYAFSEHQLTPELPQEERDRRTAKRQALAAERRQKRREAMEWGIQRELERSGVRKELWPAFEMGEAEDEILMPLPEELESGEVDLAELLDGIEALQVKKEAELDAIVQKQQPLLAAMNEIASGEAEPEAIDRLLALLDKPEMAAQVDSELSQLPSAADLPFDVATPEGTQADAALARAGDWRRAMLDAAAPKVDEAEQLALARGRFLGLPEGRPLERTRRQLTEERFSMPDLPGIPALPDGAAAAPETVSLDDALRALEENPFAPAGAAKQVRDALDSVDAKLAQTLPNLAPGGGSALRALIPAAPPPPASAEDALSETGARLKQAHAEIHAGLDAAEAQMIAGLAEMRRTSPLPLKPDVPLTPGVARALGDLVMEQAAAGLALAGRDFAGADLSDRDLSGVDLSGALLENAKLDRARLVGARLVNATLAGASLRGADLSGSDLTNANLCKVDGEGARFESARLSETMLLEARLPGVSFDGAELSRLQIMMTPLAGASFRQARVADTIVMRADLADTDWQASVLERVQVLDTPLERARFATASLHEVCILMAKAAGIDFSAARLSSVLFAGEVDLRQSSFARATSAGLTFQKADLSLADFARGRFERLCFVEAGLAGASFREATLKRGIFSRNTLTSTDFFAADLLEAQFNRADLTGASLRASNLFGADLMDATLFGADFSRANLTRTILAVASDAG
ncbi:DUF2169 domain-containing protein [Bosea sp. BK604]|uniref:DUF2169 family type VI secretion system accessory protein n=1 Tax=Bosea sp. BK604 TaxID=2512180 RepID=UPI0010D814BF|nr:DUF2169 domain-containing protein [Bosea sp. BK604]TCR64178.1 hypothetical protein EV560_107266 [Bosea sp. BK604]